jgi:hypothetical protein
MMPNAPLHYFSICPSFLRSEVPNVEVIRRAWPLFVIRNFKNGGSPRCCPVLCGLRDRCIAAMLATRWPSARIASAKVELNHRRQACAVLADTGIRAARNGRASG